MPQLDRASSTPASSTPVPSDGVSPAAGHAAAADVRTPAGALHQLLAGNRRFTTDTCEHPHQDARRRSALTEGQQPFAVVFGCSDSRLPAEIVFDRGLGDLFTVRTAGPVLGAETLASLEYGVMVLGAPLVVVLGHESCGAIRAGHAALNAGEETPPELRTLVDGVAGGFARARELGVTDLDDIDRLHIQGTVDRLAGADTAIGAAVAAGRCAVVGMSYRLADGAVAVTTPQPGVL